MQQSLLSSVLLIAGAATLSLALRSFRPMVCQKLGALGIFVTSYLIGYLLTGLWIIGVCCALSWLLLPWVEILTRIRRMRLPAERSLRHKSPPSEEAFPALDDLSRELEEEGFQHVEDAGWDWDDSQQFFRLFYRAEERTQAAICMIEQQNVSFYYMSLSSRAQDGTSWTTWNYPFPYSLKIAPHLKINRLSADQTFLQLLASHRSFLERNNVRPSDLVAVDPELIQQEIESELRSQVSHNLAAGVLTRTPEGNVRYSWRGLIFLWVQFLRDLVRFS
jgi:hypothetical protein